MAKLTRVDRLLLGIVVPIWLVVFSLHVRAAFRTGLAQPGVFVVTPDADQYPWVGGGRPEQANQAGELQPGDRLLRAGDVDLRGVGHIAFDAIAIDEAGADGVVVIEFERGEVRQSTALPLARAPVPWMRFPMLLALAGAAIFVLLRAGGTAQARLMFISFMGLAILQSPFHGGSFIETYVSKLVFYGGNLIVPPLVFTWLLYFPPEVESPSRRALWLPWLFVPVGALVRGSNVFGGPLPPSPVLGPVLDGLAVLVVLIQLTYSYSRVDRIGRRRVRWVLYGTYVGGVPAAIVLFMVLVLDPEGAWYSRVLVFPAIAVCALPLGVFIAIVRHNLFDVDRLISATASYSALVIFLVAGTAGVVLPLSQLLTSTTGMEPWFGQGLVGLLLAAIGLPAFQRLRPVIENVLFPERRALEEGIHRVLSDLASSTSPSELVARTGESLERLIRPSSCVIYARAERGFLPLFVRGTDAQPIETTDPAHPGAGAAAGTAGGRELGRLPACLPTLAVRACRARGACGVGGGAGSRPRRNRGVPRTRAEAVGGHLHVRRRRVAVDAGRQARGRAVSVWRVAVVHPCCGRAARAGAGAQSLRPDADADADLGSSARGRAPDARGDLVDGRMPSLWGVL